jgi:hypothetical protein
MQIADLVQVAYHASNLGLGRHASCPGLTQIIGDIVELIRSKKVAHCPPHDAGM